LNVYGADQALEQHTTDRDQRTYWSLVLDDLDDSVKDMMQTKARPATRKRTVTDARETHLAFVDLFEGRSEHQQEFESLPAATQAKVRSTLQDLAAALVGAGAVDAVQTAAMVRLRAQTLRDLAEVISHGDTDRLEIMMAALQQADAPDTESARADAEARNRLRLRALYEGILADSYTVKDLTAQWGISRQRLAQLRDEERLFAVTVPFQRSRLYPRWQFGEDLRPRPVMPNLIQQAKRSGLDAIDFHQLMTNSASGAGVSPVALLDRGEEQKVLDIIRAADA
jgi:hypothetical protein